MNVDFEHRSGSPFLNYLPSVYVRWDAWRTSFFVWWLRSRWAWHFYKD